METIDFLPERIKAQRQRRRRWVRLAYLLVSCAVILAAYGIAQQVRFLRAKERLNSLSDRAANVQQQVAMLGTLQQQYADLMIKKRIDEQLGSRADALDVLAELGRLMPESVAVGSLELKTVELRTTVRPALARGASAAGRPEDFVEKRVRLEMTGLAPSDVEVANFIAQLSASPLFEDVNMGYSKNTEIQDRSAREFRIGCYVIR